MNWTTEIKIDVVELELSHSSKFSLFGSCFSDNIGAYLQQYKFQTLINPFGIAYNPLSIANSFNHIFNKKQFTEADIHLLNEQWFSFHHHTKLNSSHKEGHLAKLNQIIEEGHQFLQQTDLLAITFGTAYTYQLIETGEIVANCQKVPNQFFKKSRCTVKQIIEIYEVLFKQLLSMNKQLKIILTVSPVRHLKDGLQENQKSKATLLLATDYLANMFKENVFYFPAYEIMIDELRDYRFYKKDLLHPNEVAVEYIWNKFVNTYFNATTANKMNELKRLMQQVNHKPFNPNSKQHQSASMKLIEKLQLFQKAHGIDLENEIDLLHQSGQITS